MRKGEFVVRTYRDRFDIIADVLNVAGRNARKTQIMYQANLSFSVMQKYLAEIAKASLIQYETESQRFGLTPKGREFLEAYKVYSKTFQNAEKRLNEVAAKKKILESLCPGAVPRSEHQRIIEL